MGLSDQLNFGAQIQRLSLISMLLILIVIIIVCHVLGAVMVGIVFVVGVGSVLGEVAAGGYGVVLVDVDVNWSFLVEFAAISRREIIQGFIELVRALRIDICWVNDA